ncbi:GAF domain-containing protein [Heyndrickxia oleronia]|jgi:GAF domain-containing protein|uniref:GAF domain-containing protein n=1 Tax=Heyndrickxia oleronia TaxID=38875 RepID=UPI00242EA074|nr:GAF domain-containing protein [Heyndrickxia oleronia]MCI1592570.1 GAF domain-containing protein [Heyndrickxia oleronia]MCI1612794.1 GAF domain-containing protein [Heyndrickxia oleronia]MCI1743948.1 GAF domain-containing protein [Heyndrickxia oleronia]MCI1760662.1 GAF domain-containing protein [Heyndrickxia oleronia]
MFHTTAYEGTRDEKYQLVKKQLTALIEDESNMIANLSNTAALLNQFLDRINWVGFYLVEGNELVLGPFQGLPACVRIPFGKGVCGTAVKERKTLRVEDVNQFPGHIACDSASQSEIVVPIIKNNEVIGVLDIDSPEINRFDEVDEIHLKEFVEALVKHL